MQGDHNYEVCKLVRVKDKYHFFDVVKIKNISWILNMLYVYFQINLCYIFGSVYRFHTSERQ